MNKFKLILGFVSALGASSVFAATTAPVVNVTPAVSTITTSGSAAITAVGGALIGLAALAVVFKWVKGAIFG